ncbi:hypothetical protein BGZ70_008769 [Mortierella alpina]|uniref:MHD domain-containing protein n=1 Tax=Mortierella alpina TaxID=64518 RepID=A0A9P6JDE6_MORAP|nr:hypothetical protein BGZ70_008769 [Mortierella alpina]
MYAKNITKAFQKHFVTDTQALGTFTAPWQKLSAESSELASLHGQLSLRISNEIERPLRDYARIHPEWQNLPLAETNCNRIAKEFDEKQAKVTKYTRAVEKVSGKKAEAAEQKLMDYTKQLESTRTAWRLEGPVILQKYQGVDQGRLEHLKEIVTAFEAMQTETVLLIAEMAGRTSSSVAEFDPLMDMELFASEVSVNMHSVVTHDSASLHSNHSLPSNGDAVGSLEARRSDGTHKRGLTGSSQLSNMSFSTDRSVPQSKAASVDHTKTIDTMDHARSGSSVLGSALDVPTNHVDAEGFTIPPPDHGPWSDAGMSSNYDDERSETSSFSQAPKMHLEIRQDSVTESNDEARAALERVTSTLKQTKTVSRRRPGRREVRSMYQSEDSSSAYNSFQSSPLSTGFTDAARDAASTPPAMNSPGSRLFFNHSTTHLQPNAASFSPATSRASTLGLPSVSSPSYSTSSSSNQQMIPPTPPLSLVNGGGSGTGLAPESILGINQSLVAEPGALTPTSPLSPMAPSFTTEENAAPHISSSNSHGATGAEGRHRKKQVWVASVIEKVHAHTQAGEVSKMMVTGEVMLTLEDTAAEAESGAEAEAKTDADAEHPKDTKKAFLRLENVQGLEKHIPNPAYLTAKEGAEGSYWVNLESLSQAMYLQRQQQHAGQAQGPGVVVLKYQVKTTEEDAKQKTMIPLLVHPAWKCEPHQTSLLINYKANVNCKLASHPQRPEDSDKDLEKDKQENVQLTDLSFLMPVSGEVTSVQSRPTGIWNSDSNKMLWDVDSVVMSSSGAEPHKLLARFELNAGAGSGPSQPSATAVKFRVQGRLLSDLVVSLEKAQEEGEEEEEGEREPSSFGSVRLQVQSGRYLAMP